METEIRYLNDMKMVLYDKAWATTASNFEVYYMERGLEEKDDLRYDITTIPPKMLGQEFVKTKGHYHIGAFQELYIVLEGKGIFLMQKKGEGKIQDVYYVEAKKGECVLVPSFYGHVTINPASKTLKMGNWISKQYKADYESIAEKGGFAYYYTQAGWVKNGNYEQVPELRSEMPLESMPRNLDFLEGPKSK
ncbi:MAG: glucose-6-phosphate isomerase family protein [Dehalococcoidia bacterium]